MRILWERCVYYQNEEKITNLFRKISNEIIIRCSVSINLEDLFGQNVKNCLVELEQSKICGREWRNTYE